MFPPAAGVRIGLFTPDRAFELVCREQIKNLREPALKLADLVTQQLITVLREGTVQVPSSSIFLFPYLWDRKLTTFLLRGAARTSRPSSCRLSLSLSPLVISVSVIF